MLGENKNIRMEGLGGGEKKKSNSVLLWVRGGTKAFLGINQYKILQSTGEGRF